MGIVGQAYVDKETARKNLEAAQKNVVDINEIIADAQAQLIAANNALAKATNAKETAQNALDHLNDKIDELNTTDLLYGELNSLKDELIANDTDGDGFNGGNIQTAVENIANIQHQIEELQDIITTAQESLVRRQEHVAECQEAYEHAVEVFEGYLPEDDKPSKFDLFDQEEEILKARIAAVVAALKEANLITEAINATSEDVVIRAINIIVNVCNVLDAKMDDATVKFNEYKSSIIALKNEATELKNTVNALENVNADDKAQLLSDIDGLIAELDGNIDQINTSLQNLRTMFNTNEDILERWEGNQELIAEVFSMEYFDESINDISDLNAQINEVTLSLTTIKGEVSANRRELNRYIREAIYLENNMDINSETDPEPTPEPDPSNPLYYWYVGQDHPSTNNNIVDDNTSPGWRLTGSTINADYEFNTTDNNIADDPTRREEWYIALPVGSPYHIWDDAYTEQFDTYYATDETVEFNNVTYNIFKPGTEARSLGGQLIKK